MKNNKNRNFKKLIKVIKNKNINITNKKIKNL